MFHSSFSPSNVNANGLDSRKVNVHQRSLVATSMLVKLLHHLFPTYGWIFSFPQEAGSRTASLKRSNQVRGLRHSRSVSCSVKWDPSTSPSRHCHQLTWTFISFFSLFILPQFKNFPHPWNESSSRHLHNGCHILRSLHFESFIWDIEMTLMLNGSWCIEHGRGRMHAICVNIPSKSSYKPRFLHVRSNASFKNIKSFRKMTT